MAKHFLVDDGEGRWFDYGKDHGKPVRLKVHALTREEERAVRRAAFGNRKSNKVGQETQVRLIERGETLNYERAFRALDDSENFYVGVAGSGTASTLAALLKIDVPAVGSEVCLDGKWTAEVKAALLPRFRELCRDVAEFSEEVVRGDIDEEEERTESF